MYINNNSGIYCIENKIDHKKYIGQTINFKNRWAKHLNELKRNVHFNEYLQNTWNKYGEDVFDFYILEQCNPQELDEKEIYYINKYNTLNRDFGYNLKTGGQQSGVLSDESLDKLRNSIKKTYLNPERRKIQSINAYEQWANPKIKAKICGKNNGMHGKHHTEATRKKISDSRKGKPIKKRHPNRVFCFELNKEFENSVEAGKQLLLDSSCILKVCRGERKTCGGYHWNFI